MHEQAPGGVSSATPCPVPARRRASRGCIISLLMTSICVLVLCSLLSVWFVSYARYESSHDIPNPVWGLIGRTFSYTPQQEPPSPALLDSRPEAVVLQFIADYRSVAETFRCAQDLASYVLSGENTDPILSDQDQQPPAPPYGRRCAVHRPVSAVMARSALVGLVGHFQQFEAVVHLEVAYADGARYVTTIAVFPNRYQEYWDTHIHLDCWDFIGMDSFYWNTRLPLSEKRAVRLR